MISQVYKVFIAKCKASKKVPLGCFKGSLNYKENIESEIEKFRSSGCSDKRHLTNNTASLTASIACLSNPELIKIASGGLKEHTEFSAGTMTVTDSVVSVLPAQTFVLSSRNEDGTANTINSVKVVYYDDLGVKQTGATLAESTDYTVSVDPETGDTMITLDAGYSISTENAARGAELVEVNYDYSIQTALNEFKPSTLQTLKPFYLEVRGENGFVLQMEDVTAENGIDIQLGVYEDTQSTPIWEATFTTAGNKYRTIDPVGSSCGGSTQSFCQAS